MAEIWVFSEKLTLVKELLGGAQNLAGAKGWNIVALAAGPRAEAEALRNFGAGKVYWLGDLSETEAPEDLVPTLAQLVQLEQPDVVMLSATTRGRAIAGRLAARLSSSFITDVRELSWQDDGLAASHMIFGGGAERIERPLGRPALLTVAPGIFSPQPGNTGQDAEVVVVERIDPPWRATVRERRARPPATVNLSAAKRVVCPGRGLRQKEDLGLIEDLARALRAEIGCTRPLAEGLDWLPRERYIGISGAQIRPDLYLGVGVSGQVQHMIGMGDSRLVVAINKDKDAPIFAQSDYGIVGDLYEVVPALLEALRSQR